MEQLPIDQTISISYPISTQLLDGTLFSVNSNAELKLAIDSCSKEDIINYCSDLFGGCNCPEKICVWKIPYTIDGDNKYASGFFENNENGTLNFNYNGNTFLGTWTFLYVDDKLHLNINLEGNSQVALDWNIDKPIELFDANIKIIDSPKNIILRKNCQTTSEYAINSIGPAGGIVFFDKGSYSNGWRYIEGAQLDLSTYEWGCLGTFIENTNSPLVGNGELNSIMIANYHDNLNGFYSNPSVCNVLNNGSVVSKEALISSINNFTDWFLPSEDELVLMYQNLKINGLGNFTDSIYWTSTQIDENNVKTIDFSNGSNSSQSKLPTPNTIKARAIRYF